MIENIIKKGASVYTIYKFIGGAFAGLVLLGFAYMFWADKKAHKGWIKTTGKIVNSECDRIVERIGRRRRTTRIFYSCDMKVQFTDTEGEQHTSPLSTTRGSRRYNTGTSVDIAYNPKNPADIRLHSETKTLIILLLVAGLIALAVSIFGIQYCVRKDCSTIGVGIVLSKIFGFSIMSE